MNEKGWASDRRDDVGKRLGVSGPAVTYWWNGDRLPTMNQAIVIATEMSCCVEWLLTGRGPMRPRPSETDCLDISELPDVEKAIFKAHVDTRTQQILKEKKGHYDSLPKTSEGT